MKLLIFLSLFPLLLCGQQTKEIISVRVGYQSTNIVFKEAFEPTFFFFGLPFNSGKTFTGDGPEFGISKSFDSRLFIDLSYSFFSGTDTKTIVNDNENWYTLEGFQIPLTVNYLLRNHTKRLRFNLCAGFKYLDARLKQFETIEGNMGQVTYEVTDIKISEFQFVGAPGIQFRIIPNLFASFIVKLSISAKGRYSDNPCFTIRYSFTGKIKL